MYITKALKFISCAAVLLLGAQTQAHDKTPEVTIEAIPVAEGIYMLTGSGGNMGLSVGDDGAFLIDDQFAPLTDKIQAKIATLSDQQVKFLINTHWHFDHTGGNENFGKRDAIIVAHHNVRTRLEAGGVIEAFKKEVPPAPSVALPVITFEESLSFHFNGETIHVEHPAPAHTDGDAIVFFDKANVVHMGDTYFNGFYPFIDASSGGSVLGVIQAVDSVLKKIDGKTKIIPGHGKLSNKAELQAYHDMLAAVYAEVKKLKAKGMSVEAVVAAKPTAKFDAKWGAGFLAPDVWVALVYGAM
ncbi:MBL fold metallo-hydrolase [Simiduia curdlanivorans]|uniref:MBL fold metallo-hydrolase n=1 Tax=Simiduia curdlanivorans TaxID=1492769 RepID=A0ABV8V8D0_9GAMM|nr:MBL fold metallo-hydrolase [Simiduia curdlanivorans]MDN3639498.1 MBL fold metallo-hydrolase [Simiduia curdlanivorans]